MKRILLFFTLIFFFNLSSVGQDYDYCECLEYYRKSQSKKNSFIEVRKAIPSDKLKGLTYSILNDTVLYASLNSVDTIKPIFIPNLSANNKFHHSPQVGFAMDKDTALITDIFSSYIDSFPHEFDSLRFIWGYKGFTFQDDERTFYSMYAITSKNDTAHYLPESAIQYARESIDPYNGELGIEASMNVEGAERFEEMSSKNVGEFLAILSENKVLSAPVINAPILGGSIHLAGDFSKADARTLIWLINCKNIEQRLGSKMFKTKMEDCK